MGVSCLSAIAGRQALATADGKLALHRFHGSYVISDKHCPFCSLPPDRIISESDYTVTIRDGFPVSKGHTLIIPKRHVQSFFELQAIEKAAVLQALDENPGAPAAPWGTVLKYQIFNSIPQCSDTNLLNIQIKLQNLGVEP